MRFVLTRHKLLSCVLSTLSILFVFTSSDQYAEAGETGRRDLASLNDAYRKSVLRGWKFFQTSYAFDSVACVHCHRDHEDMTTWMAAYPKVQLFDGAPFRVKTLRQVVLDALERHTDAEYGERVEMVEDLIAYISWWGDGQTVMPGISEPVPPPSEDLEKLRESVDRGRELFNREKPLSCAYCHTADGQGSSYRTDLSRCFTRFPAAAGNGERTISLHAYLAEHRMQMGVFMGPKDIPDLAAFLADLSRGRKLRPGGQPR